MISLVMAFNQVRSCTVHGVSWLKSLLIFNFLLKATEVVKSYRTVINSINFVLVDTPGFNDTRRDDGEILEELASWLNSTYRKGFKLTGIVYLQPINVTRVEGTDLLNVRIFRKLCGKETYKHIVLASTFWDRVDEVTGARREKELCETPDFWGKMKSQGSRVVRIRDYAESKNLLLDLAGKSTITLGIQREMVDQNKSLADTATGKLKAEHDAGIARAKHAMAEAVKKRDEENRRKCQEQLKRHKSVRDMQKAIAENQKLEQERIFKARMKDVEKEAESNRLKENKRIRALQQENERLIAEKQRLTREREQNMAQENMSPEEMTRKFLYNKYRTDFASQSQTLQQAQTQGKIRTYAHGFHHQSPVFLRWCDKCFELIGFNGFYSTCAP